MMKTKKPKIDAEAEADQAELDAMNAQRRRKVISIDQPFDHNLHAALCGSYYNAHIHREMPLRTLLSRGNETFLSLAGLFIKSEWIRVPKMKHLPGCEFPKTDCVCPCNDTVLQRRFIDDFLWDNNLPPWDTIDLIAIQGIEIAVESEEIDGDDEFD
ncbi:unnamed protein product [uncultured bacterium]|nr:unnamed protein product [uncultured bacterium]